MTDLNHFLNDDLLESLSNDKDSTWNERSIAKILGMRSSFLKQVAILEDFSLKMARQSKVYSLVPTILNGIVTTAMSFEWIREIVIFRDGSIDPSIMNMIILTTGAIISLISTSMQMYHRTEAYERKIVSANACKSQFQFMISEIDKEFYKKTKYRENLNSFINRIEHLKQMVNQKLSYDLNIQAIMDDDVELGIRRSSLGRNQLFTHSQDNSVTLTDSDD